MKKVGSVILFLISSLTLTAFVIMGRTFNGYFSGQTWWASCCLILAIAFVGFFCTMSWLSLEKLNERTQDASTDLPEIKDNRRDVHLTRLDHVDREVTRYRDLCWKIVGLVWAIYYVLNQSRGTFLEDIPYFICLFLTAASGTVFLLFCELSANRNRTQRRELANQLGHCQNDG